ncbi:MAG: hypothetical protein ABJM82_05295 [Shimia thalassica]|uniref:hypothetical protein n=1 Tax=Shimia thalassica TaxID=1715693 RepID=UPI003299A65F
MGDTNLGNTRDVHSAGQTRDVKIALFLSVSQMPPDPVSFKVIPLHSLTIPADKPLAMTPNRP